jgi:hypothetical protein
MQPAISYEGYSVSPEVKGTPVMEKLGEVLSGLNAVWIDVDSDTQDRKEVKQVVINKFFDTRNNGHLGKFLTFLIDSRPYVVVFQYVKNEEGDSAGMRNYEYENVWKRVVEKFPDAQLKDGGNCTVGKYDVILSGKAAKLQAGGSNPESLVWRPIICGKLAWVSKVGRALPKKGGENRRYFVISSSGRLE